MYKISFNDTQNTICLIYFLSHMIFKCEITIKNYSYNYPTSCDNSTHHVERVVRVALTRTMRARRPPILFACGLMTVVSVASVVSIVSVF